VYAARLSYIVAVEDR